MKNLGALFFCFVLSGIATMHGQNLVANGSFEIIDTCYINTATSFSIAPSWDAPNLSSPDLYNVCSINPYWSTPANQFGYQVPHTGTGYAGQVYYNNREFMQTHLTAALIPNQIYQVSYYVNLVNIVSRASNNFGVYFSSQHTATGSYNSLALTPQLNYTGIISDTANWVLISDTYTAQGGEEYMILGNFYNEFQTQTAVNQGTLACNCSYYYIDDVSVECISCGNNVGIKELVNDSGIKMFPNPANEMVNITSNTAFTKIEISDVAGCVVVAEIQNAKTYWLSTENISSGIYFVNITYSDGRKVAKRLVVNH